MILGLAEAAPPLFMADIYPKMAATRTVYKDSSLTVRDERR